MMLMRPEMKMEFTGIKRFDMIVCRFAHNFVYIDHDPNLFMVIILYIKLIQ